MLDIVKDRIMQVQNGMVPDGYTWKWHLMPSTWKDVPLSKIFSSKAPKNKGNYCNIVFTNSAEHGIIPQSDYFDKEIANQENIEGYYIVHPGDYVYNPRISEHAPYGPFKRNDTNITGVVSPLYTVISPRKEFEHCEFLRYYLESNQWHKYAYSIANYGARFDRMNITGQDLMELPIALPPTDEREKIAQILAQCDKLIELKQKRIDSEKKYRQALLDELLYRPFLNRKWKLAFVEEVASVFGRIGFRGYTKADIVSAGQGALSLSPSNIEDNVLKTTTGTYVTWEKYYESPEIMIQADDILFVKTGSTYGKCARVNKISCASTINPQLVIVRPQHINSIFLEKIFRSRIVQHRVEQIVVGGAVPTLTQEEIRKFVIPVPTLAEQVHISNVLDALDRTIELLEKERTLWIIKKRALMQLLLTGTVRVKI